MSGGRAKGPEAEGDPAQPGVCRKREERPPSLAFNATHPRPPALATSPTGRPLAMLFRDEGAATVTVLHRTSYRELFTDSTSAEVGGWVGTGRAAVYGCTGTRLHRGTAAVVSIAQ